MSYELVNRIKGPSTLMVVDGSVTINLGDLAVAVANISGVIKGNVENVTTAIITSCKWSTPVGGTVKISRDAGGVATGPNLVANLSGTNQWIHNEVPFANTPTGNIAVAITGGGTVYLTIKKEAVYNVQTQSI